MSDQTNLSNSALASLIGDLRTGRIDRRTFLMKSAASGITIAAASALATDALSQPTGTGPEQFAKTIRAQVQTNIDVRLPQSLRFEKQDLEGITSEFNDKLIDVIKQRGWDNHPNAKPVIKQQVVSETQSVSVDVA